MPREVVFHIGDPKTGTTSIQHALRRRLFTSSGKSVSFPTEINSIRLSQALQAGESDRIELIMAKVVKAVGEQPADVTVVSAEQFAFVPPAALKSAVDAALGDVVDRTSVIAYVRPHVPAFLSAFSQRVKTGSVHDGLATWGEKAMGAARFDYHRRFDAWCAVWGEDDVNVRVMERSLLQGQDAVTDFLAQITGSDDVRLTEDVSVNSSVTVPVLTGLAVFHHELARLGISSGTRHAVGHALSIWLGNDVDQPGERVAMSKQRLAAFADRFGADSDAMDTRWFAGTPLRDALEKSLASAPDAEVSYDASTYYSAADLGQITQLAGNIAKALGDVETQWLRHFRSSLGRPIQAPRLNLHKRQVERIDTWIDETGHTLVGTGRG